MVRRLDGGPGPLASLSDQAWEPHRVEPRLPRFLLIVTIIAIGLTTVAACAGIWDRYRRTIDTADVQLRDLCFTLAEQAERSLQTTDLILRSTERDVFFPGSGSHRSQQELDSLLRARISGIPQIQGHSALDASGRVLASTRAQQLITHVTQLKPYRFIVNARDAVTFITPEVAFPEYPRPSILIVRRVESPDGKFLGIVSVAIEPQFFNHIYGLLQKSAPYRIRLEREDGVILAGDGARAFPVDQTLPSPLPVSFRPPIVESPSPTVVSRTQGEWITSTVALTNLPLRVEIALPREWVLTAWRLQAWVIGLIAGASCLLVSLLATLLNRELKRRATIEQRVTAQTKLFRTVYDTVPHPIFVKDLRGHYLDVNRAMVELWGAPSAPVPASGIDASTAEEHIVLTEGREVAVTQAVALPNGHRRQFHVIRRPLRDDAGTIVGLVGTAVDETGRLAAEQSMRDSRQLLAAIFDTIPHHIWMKDRSGKLVTGNRSLEQYIGQTVEQMKGSTIVGAGFRPPEENARIAEEDRRVLQLGESISDIQWATAPNGTRRRFHAVKRPLYSSDGQIAGLVAISMDLTEITLTQEALQQSQALLKTVFDALPLAVMVMDRDRRVVVANRACESIWGIREADMLNQNLSDLVGVPGERAELEAIDARVVREDRILEHKTILTMPHGKRLHLRAIKAPLHDANGRVNGLLALCEDVTEHAQAQEKLAHSQALLKTVFDAIPMWVMVKDLDDRLLAVNHQVTVSLGLPAEQLIGKRLRDTNAPEGERIRVAETDAQVIREDRVLEYEIQRTMPNGRVRQMRAIKAPLHDSAGRVTGIVAVSEDITDHAEAARALRESQVLLRTVFDTIPMAVLVKDLDDRLLVVNPATAARWGVPPETLIGKHIADLDVPNPQREKVRDSDRRVVEEDRVLDYEIERTMPDGKTRLLRAIKAPLHAPDGKVSGILALSEDITERRRTQEEKAQLERQLEQVQKMDTVGRLAGGIAHDFNNLLTPVIGFVDLALRRVPPGDPLARELGMIREAATRAAELTRSLLSFSRAQVMTLRPVNLNDEIQALDRMLSRVIGEGIQIVLNLAPDLALVQADTTQMQQVLMNLAVNARDAMPSGGKLVIESSNISLDAGYAERVLEVSSGHYVMISVSDTGGGMSADVQARIFEPFFTTKETSKGTGLGLSIVYGIVRQHHGTIRVYSDLGKGTSFKILLPRFGDAVESVPTPKRSLDQLQGREHILVVEDESRVRDAVAALLSSLGYSVLEASSPKDALDLLNSTAPEKLELLITDMMLPGKTGRELYASMRDKLPNLAVLYMSGYPRDVLAESSAAVDREYFIGKPFGLQDLAERVRAVLTQRGGD